MKYLFSKISKKVTLPILVLVVALGAAGYSLPKVYASLTDNAHGTLFSDMPDPSDQCKVGAPGCGGNGTNEQSGRGLGWIAVNNVDLGASPQNISYGVSLNGNNFSGQGWSDWGGWVDFAPGGPYPTGAGTTAHAAEVGTTCTQQYGCPVLGWIRYIAGENSNQSQTGGWDGWVSLHGNAGGGGAYGVMYQPSTGTFTGHGWGDKDVGWIDFTNMTIQTVQQNPTHICEDPTATNYVPGPYTANQVSDPSTCQYANQTHICENPAAVNYVAPPYTSNQISDPITCIFKINPGTHYVCDDPAAVNYVAPPYTIGTIGTTSVCNYDFCPDNPQYPATQGVQPHVPFQFSGVWYGILGGGICGPSVCPNLTGFYATPPPGDVVLPDGTCGTMTDYCATHPTDPACQAGPIKPIYKEN